MKCGKLSIYGLYVLSVGLFGCENSDKAPEFVTAWSLSAPKIVRDGQELGTLKSFSGEQKLHASDELHFKNPAGVTVTAEAVCDDGNGEPTTWMSRQKLSEKHAFLEFLPPRSVLYASLGQGEGVACELNFTATNVSGSQHRFSLSKRNYSISNHGDLTLSHESGFAVGDFTADKVRLSAQELGAYVVVDAPQATRRWALHCTLGEIGVDLETNPFKSFAQIHRQRLNQDGYFDQCRLFALGDGNILALTPLLEVRPGPIGPAVVRFTPQNGFGKPKYFAGASFTNTSDRPAIYSIDLTRAGKTRHAMVLGEGYNGNGAKFAFFADLPVKIDAIGFKVLSRTPSEIRVLLMPNTTGQVLAGPAREPLPYCRTSGIYLGYYWTVPVAIVSEVTEDAEFPPAREHIVGSSLLFDENAIWEGVEPPKPTPGINRPVRKKSGPVSYTRVATDCQVR